MWLLFTFFIFIFMYAGHVRWWVILLVLGIWILISAWVEDAQATMNSSWRD